MSGNIIALLTALVLGVLAFGFGLQSAKQTQSAKQWLVLFIWLLSLFLIINTFFAFNGWRSLKALTTMPAITTVRQFQGTADGEPLILVGTVSQENKVLRADTIVAYFECGEPCYLFSSPPLMIDLRGGVAGIGNRDFQEREWTYQRGINYSYYSLELDDPVVVIGQRASDLIQAEILYRGQYENFLEHTQQKMTTALLMIWLNATASAALIGTGLAYWDPENNPLKKQLGDQDIR